MFIKKSPAQAGLFCFKARCEFNNSTVAALPELVLSLLQL